MKTFASLRLLPFIFIAAFVAAGNKDIHVLFVGNSYTYYNELPTVVASLATDAGLTIHVRHHTRGGYSLLQHVEEKEIFRVINSEAWDYVVLQDHSMRPEKLPKKLYEAARILDQKIKARGARTVFYMTWARAYNPGMNEALEKVYTKAAKELGALLVPVGKAWALALKQPGGINLYIEDGSHPNPHGTYLTACMFLGKLTGKLPEGLGNGGLKEVSPEEAKTLQDIARRTLQ